MQCRLPLVLTPLTLGACAVQGEKGVNDQRPNILLVIADDQSFPYASAYGTPGIHTPGFDYVAANGVCFSNAYATSPGSSPSRASLLTGKYPWQIKEAGTHASSFPSDYMCYPELFESFGYRIGFTGKGWGPGDWKISGRAVNPAGPEYNQIRLDPPNEGISDIDYTSNFLSFLEDSPQGQPFCFWFGAKEPHRPYSYGYGEESGVNPDEILVPEDLPDADVIRTDIADYISEIEWFDSHLVNILSELEIRGLLENTIVVVTADNGMPFPHAKANCYDSGLHVPLAICWGDNITRHCVDPSIVSLVDIFPTLLDLCDIDWDKADGLSGESLLAILGLGGKEYTREASFGGRERHSSARFENAGYPSRCIRTDKWLLVRNFHPERWPAGDPPFGNLEKPYDGYYDIDPSPTLRFMIDNRSDTLVSAFFNLATDKRPEFELFDIESDPGCKRDLSRVPFYKGIADSLKTMLQEKLESTCDSRLGSDPEIWESYPRLSGPIRLFHSQDSINSFGDNPNCFKKHREK